MTAKHVYTYVNPPVAKDLEFVAHVLAHDGVIAYPTDVNWAIGCDAASPKALDRIRQLKPQHPREQPFSLLCASIAMVSQVANVDNNAYGYLRRALPGPYTILLERNRSLPRQIKDKRKIVGIRVPQHPLIQSILNFTERPLASTSVPSIEIDAGSPTVCRFGFQVMEYFGHALDIVLDLGDEVSGEETTIVDLTDGPPRLVRQGIGDAAVFGL